jgi:ASTRA-associated protein 1
MDCFFTCGADAIVAKHPIPDLGSKLETAPLATVDTKHSGQQGLSVRSDGKIFATAGWDGKVRVYSPKTMKEVAVLKWHDVGCYAVAFSEVEEDHLGDANEGSLLAKSDTIRSRRIQHAQTAHWLAAGSKDGKVSLWEIY